MQAALVISSSEENENTRDILADSLCSGLSVVPLSGCLEGEDWDALLSESLLKYSLTRLKIFISSSSGRPSSSVAAHSSSSSLAVGSEKSE